MGLSCARKQVEIEPGSEKPAFAPPGAIDFPEEKEQAIGKAIKALPADYVPRTRHRNEDGSAKYSNRLLLEKSPYLLQHAHNPVNWFPWGDEAFELAKKLGRPVLLSVGYSTCHWCHVMEEESFEDPEIARYINENYIAIKVDREERPDIDSIYMKAVQRLTGGGGWPMNVWLTPERKPFFGGTYFPPRTGARGGGRPGFIEVLTRAKSKYDENPAKVTEVADQLIKAIAEDSKPVTGAGGSVDEKVLVAAAEHYARTFDATNGGVTRRRNKFPSSLPIRFLLRYARRTGDPKYAEMAAMTLFKMAQGGIYDQVGGGFHRYATDTKWLVPHFEKMLYDNALLVVAYLEGYQATGDLYFRDIAFDVLAYLHREMRSPEGGFYSATDADSENGEGEKEEGVFFTWTPKEVDAALSPADAKLAKALYGIRRGGNYEGRTVLAISRPIEAVAKSLGLKPADVVARIRPLRDAMYQQRNARKPPERDDKVLTAWNGLAISAFAKAARVVLDGESKARIDHLAVARKAAEFVLSKLSKDGRLLRSYLSGEGKLNAYLEDYAFFIQGLIDLYEASHEERYLREAIRLEALVEKHYLDSSGGYFQTSNDHESLLVREKPAEDKAIPSGNSVHALNLVRLYELTSDVKYLERARSAVTAFSAILLRQPSVLSEMLLAIDFMTDAAREIVIVAPEAGTALPFESILAKTFLPNHVYVAADQSRMAKLAKTIPLADRKLAIKGKTTAYVCQQTRCDLPTSDPAVFAKQLATAKAIAQ